MGHYSESYDYEHSLNKGRLKDQKAADLKALEIARQRLRELKSELPEAAKARYGGVIEDMSSWISQQMVDCVVSGSAKNEEGGK